MKQTILFFAACLLSLHSWAQAAYVLPSPTGKNDSITLYINVAQTSDGVQNNALNAILNDHPDDSVYLWTWQPSGPVAGNGSWDNSNEALRMTKVDDKLYSIRFKPTSFYGVDATQFFTLGISCLAKLKNGGAYAGEYNGEAKTEDLKINIIPRLCDELYCVFPEIAKTDDYFTVTYDNNQETNPSLQNLGDDECYLFLRAEQSAFNAVNYASPELTSTTPELKMKPVAGEDGFFRLTIIPEDFFGDLLPEGFDFKTLKYYVLKPGYVYPSSPPTQSFSFLQCD